MIATVTELLDQLERRHAAARPPAGAECECGAPAAGPGAVRCEGCGAAICPECARPFGGGPPVALCWGCAVAELADAPPDAAEAAWMLMVLRGDLAAEAAA